MTRWDRQFDGHEELWAQHLSDAIVKLLSTELCDGHSEYTELVDQMLAQLRGLAARDGTTLQTQVHLARAVLAVHTALATEDSWYESSEVPGAHTLEELREIAKRCSNPRALRASELGCRHVTADGRRVCAICCYETELVVRECFALALVESQQCVLQLGEWDLAVQLLEELVRFDEEEDSTSRAASACTDTLLDTIRELARQGEQVPERLVAALRDRAYEYYDAHECAAYGVALTALAASPVVKELQPLFKAQLEYFREHDCKRPAGGYMPVRTRPTPKQELRIAQNPDHRSEPDLQTRSERIPRR